MKIKNLKRKYANYYINLEKSKLYPSEYLVRIFLSNRNKQRFNFPQFKNKKFLDLSCGDGRNLKFFYFAIYFDAHDINPFNYFYTNSIKFY